MEKKQPFPGIPWYRADRMARFVHVVDEFSLHAQYRLRKSAHPNARSSALGFPTYMYMYLYMELRETLIGIAFIW